jgi:hypothetical protein
VGRLAAFRKDISELAHRGGDGNSNNGRQQDDKPKAHDEGSKHVILPHECLAAAAVGGNNMRYRGSAPAQKKALDAGGSIER